MKKNILKHSIYAALFAASTAQAADTYTMVGGNFDFYDGQNVLSPQTEAGGFSHKSVFADGLLTRTEGGASITSAVIDFTNNTGRLLPAEDFNGAPWAADINNVNTTLGATTYTWTIETWFINGANATCRISGTIDGCIDENASGGLFLGTATDNFAYTLGANQFALHLFFDWNGTLDIPVLAVFNIDGIDAEGNLTVSAVDTDGTGVPGTAMKTPPFPDNTPAFSGVFRPVSKDPVFSAQSPLATNEETLLTITQADFTESGFPSIIYAAGSKSLSIQTGATYATNASSTVTPNLNIDTALSVSVGLSIDQHTGLTYAAATPEQKIADAVTSVGAVATVTLTGHGYSSGDLISITGGSGGADDILTSADSAYNGNYIITVVDANSFTYNFAGSTTAPAVSTFESTKVLTTTTPMGFNAAITVNPLEDNPIISGTPATVAPDDQVYNFTPAVSDPDTGDGFTCSFTSTTALPAGISLGGTNNCTLSGTPTSLPGYVAQGIIITVTDDSPSTLTASLLPAFDITVTGTNPPPVLLGTPVTSIDEDASYSFDVMATDAGDTVTYSISGNPGWMSMAPNAGNGPQASDTVATISGTPANADVGATGTITITATDSAGGTDTINFAVITNNINNPPTIAAGDCTSTNIEAQSAFSCTPTFSDIDVGDSLTLSANGLPASLSLAIDPATGRISGTTVDADVGLHNITVIVTDAAGATDQFVFGLTVDAFIAPPTAGNLSISTLQGITIDSTADLNDTYIPLADLVTVPRGCEPGCLVFSVPAGGDPTNGVLTLNPNGNYTYAPNAGFNNDRDSFQFEVSDGVKTSNIGTVNIVVGVVQDDEYPASNFTMIDLADGTLGGTNDVVARWNGIFNTDESDTTFDNMSISSPETFVGFNWTAHHIRVFGPGTYQFDSTCTAADYDVGTTDCNRPQQSAPPPGDRFAQMTIGSGQIGAHILFDWNTTKDIDVVLVWNTNEVYPGDGSVDGNGVLTPELGVARLHQDIGYGNFPWSGVPSFDTNYRLASQDVDGDGIAGAKMVDGPFVNLQANFNLDIVTDASNMTILDGGGNIMGGANDVNVNWNGITTNDEASIAFGNMRLSSTSTLTVNGGATDVWVAHHIRIFAPLPGVASQTFTFDTTCSATDLEAGTTDCGGTKVTLTVNSNQIGGHMLIDWNGETDVHVVNLWDTGQKVDPADTNETAPSRRFQTDKLFLDGNVNTFPWSEAADAAEEWNMVSIDADADTVPGIAIVNGGTLNGLSISFNNFVAAGTIAVLPVDDSVISDPDTGTALGLAGIFLMWLGILKFGYRRK